jgi:hypothetical protein
MSYPNGSSVTQGDTIHFNAKYTASGQVQVRVTGVDAASDFFSKTTFQLTGAPFPINPGQSITLDLHVTVESGAPVGSHQLTFTTHWDAFDPMVSQWVNQSPWDSNSLPPLTITANSSPNPPQTPSSQNPTPNGGGTPWELILGAIAAVAVAALLAGLLLYQRKPKGPQQAFPSPPQTPIMAPLQSPGLFCPNCGTQNSAGTPFCTNCGSRIQGLE